MNGNDTCWCPVCERQIRPKHYQVPIAPIPPPPPPSSLICISAKSTRQRGGLVTRTGRINTNSTIKKQQQQLVKSHTVIDPGHTPLYCSDECQLAEMDRALPRNFEPNSHSNKSSSSLSYSPGSVSSPPSSSVDSHSSAQSAPLTTEMSPSLAIIASIYNFPPLPPPPPVDDYVPCLRSPPLENGVIMAARRISENLYKKRSQKRDCYGRAVIEPIPGWTDGSNAWRSSVYNLTAPNTSLSPTPNKSFASHSSCGIESTMTANASSPCNSSSLATHLISESDAELLTSFSQSFRRTSQPSTPLPPIPLSPLSPLASFPLTPPPQIRERPLLHRGAEGKLLVPQVMMRVNKGASSASPLQSYRRSTRSLSSDEGDTTRCGSGSLRPRGPKRPSEETRSWTYDNVRTYPIMRLPPKKKVEKRMEKRVVNGEEVEIEVEIEVEVEEKLKRLFLFPAPMTA